MQFVLLLAEFANLLPILNATFMEGTSLERSRRELKFASKFGHFNDRGVHLSDLLRLVLGHCDNQLLLILLLEGRLERVLLRHVAR